MQKYLKILTVFLIVAPSWTVSIQLNEDIQKKIEENEEKIRQLEAQNQENEKYLNFEEAITSTKDRISALEKRLNQCRNQSKRRQCKADDANELNKVAENSLKILACQKDLEAQRNESTNQNMLNYKNNEVIKELQLKMELNQRKLNYWRKRCIRVSKQLKNVEQNLISKEDELNKCISKNQRIYVPRTQNNFKSPPSSCLNLTKGVKQIQLTNGISFEAVCDGDGWMIIQQRFDGSENFVRYWSDYVNGFGNLGGEFWIGLEKLHLVTNLARHLLLISIINSRESFVAEYDDFRVGNSATFYNLESIGKYTGNLNVLGRNVNRQFVTFDQNRNLNGFANCLEGGWWFLPNCEDYNLNALYNQGVLWSNRNTIMKIRPNGIGH
ncbi:angiopoietin-related protein 3-like isoform X2 [Drosophila nasuta]|uniref:angiopoietin-related protein 3-like isoform X2 n=1 Tax=Drosophila nasuta TaxID=42062 RepID=UPI00295F1FFE|nr:angiopoietin-related protein 3-like isoform X2 [Drosophila nasuta]